MPRVTRPQAPTRIAASRPPAGLGGDRFDRMYMARMMADHRKAVSLFRRQSRSGQDAALKAFAQKTLPTLQAHLDMMRKLHDRPACAPAR